MTRLGKCGIPFVGILALGWILLPMMGANTARAQENPISESSVEETAPASGSQIETVQANTEDGQVVVRVEATGALQYTAFKLTEPLRLVLDFQDMAPSTVTAPIQVNQGVVGNIRSLYFDDARVQRLEIDLTSTAAYEIQKPVPNQVLIRLKGSGPKVAQVPAPVPAEPEKPMTPAATQAPQAAPPMDRVVKSSSADPCVEFLAEKNQIISAEFKEASLTNVFRFLSELAGINVVVSPAIAATANLRVDNSPWNQVFQLLMANHDLGITCIGGIVRVTPAADLQNERFEQPFVTQLARLNYADPDIVVLNLKELSTAAGSVVADKRTNSVIMSDTERVVADMVEVIRNLDKPTKQVHIESKIVQVNRAFTQELGIQWGFSGTSLRNPQFPGAIQFSGAARGDGFLSQPVQSGGTNFATGTSPLGTTPSVGTALTDTRIDPGFIVDLATLSPPFGAIATSLRSLSGDLTLDLQLTALERQGKSRIVTAPKVTALDNKEATIRSGTRLPFQTTDPTSGTQIQFIDAVIELKVTPHVTVDNMVYMKVDASQNAPDPSVGIAGLPGVDTKEASTELLVNNQDTAILGGLFQKSITDNTRAVPYASEIPIVGNLFKSNLEVDNIDELLIFITPTIVGEM